MILFLFCALITFLVLFLLAYPFLRPTNKTDERDEHGLDIYRDQLAELKKDVERGLVLPEEEKEAQTEIERRMLLEAEAQSSKTATHANGNIFMFGLIGLLPILAGLVYFAQGKPDQQATPYASRTDLETAPTGADGMHSDMSDIVGSLQTRLSANPEDAEGWALLARSLVNLRRHSEAVSAYQEANRLTGGRDRQLAAEYAETLVIANEGIVGQEAERIFQIFIEENANDPQARYYLALAKAQRGATEEAVDDWRALLQDSPASAPWVSIVESQIAAVEGSSVPQSSASTQSALELRNPTAEQVQAAQQLSSNEQSQMIEGMVANLAMKLEENPNDVPGWQRLARSYSVLGQTENARRAYEQVLRLSPNDEAAKVALEALSQD